MNGIPAADEVRYWGAIARLVVPVQQSGSQETQVGFEIAAAIKVAA
jgi:hypothetical protein